MCERASHCVRRCQALKAERVLGSFPVLCMPHMVNLKAQVQAAPRDIESMHAMAIALSSDGDSLVIHVDDCPECSDTDSQGGDGDDR